MYTTYMNTKLKSNCNRTRGIPSANLNEALVFLHRYCN